jgi:small-conductance mechanosensitive channel
MLKNILIFAELEQDNLEKASELIADITANKVLQGLLVLLAIYLGQMLVERLIHWLGEKLPLKYRLLVKESLPFCRAFLFGLGGVFLINLFLNLSQSNLLPLTGTIAVAVGFAFKDYISSVIAGILALFEAPYQVGDRIKIGEHYGEIVSYGLRAIIIQTPDDDAVTIPHNKMWTEAIVNANKGSLEAQTVINFYFRADVDVAQVAYLLEKIAQTSKYTQLDLPIIVVAEEKPWATNFRLKCYPLDARDEFIYQSDILKRAKKTFREYGFDYPTLPIVSQ